jgi:hypothetical protein
VVILSLHGSAAQRMDRRVVSQSTKRRATVALVRSYIGRKLLIL